MTPAFRFYASSIHPASLALLAHPGLCSRSSALPSRPTSPWDPRPESAETPVGRAGGRSVPVGAFLPTDSVAALVTPGPHVWRKFHPYLQPLFTLRPSQITWVNGTSRKRSGWFTVAIRAQGTRQSLALPATQNVAGGPTVCSPPGLAQPGPCAAQTPAPFALTSFWENSF